MEIFSLGTLHDGRRALGSRLLQPRRSGAVCAVLKVGRPRCGRSVTAKLLEGALVAVDAMGCQASPTRSSRTVPIIS